LGYGCSHEHNHLIEDKTRLCLALLINAFVMPLEIYFGYKSGSFSLFSDGIHMVSHLGLLSFACFVEIKKKYQFYSVFINGLFLLRLSMYVLCCGLWRIFSPSEIMGGTMLIVAFIGLVADIGQIILFYPARRYHSKNMKSAFWHTLSDMLLSAVVVASALLVYFFSFYKADMIALFVFFPIIFWYGGINLIKESMGLIGKK
jgi:cobalt-zinc-cadmium efflux system protein